MRQYHAPSTGPSHRVNSQTLSTPLRGIHIVLTRPVGSGKSLQLRLGSDGAHCVNLPVLAIRTLVASDALHAALDSAARADALVFASPNAVRACFRLCPQFRPRGLVFAQGPATAQALQRRGLQPIQPEHGFTTEDLLRHPFFAAVAGRRVLRLAGQGGRDLLVNSLRERGCDAAAIALYRRAPARWQKRHRDLIGTLVDPILVVSSAEVLDGLAAHCDGAQWARVRGWRILVSSPRLESAAGQLGFAHVHLARSAASADLRAGLLALTEASLGR
jgi:uroporphyrinogen-III synthase